jgi:polyphosphate kinase
MLRRVELAWPVEDVSLRRRIVNECLTTYLHDNVDAWTMHADGHYTQVNATRNSNTSKTKPTLGAQGKLMALYSAKG